MPLHREPLGDKTNRAANERRNLYKNLFKPHKKRDNVLKFLKSFTGAPEAAPQAPAKTSQRTSELIHKIDRDLHREASAPPVLGSEPAVVRGHGPLTAQLAEKSGKIQTMNAILKYSDPVLEVPNPAETGQAVKYVQEMGGGFRIVELESGEQVGLLSFGKLWMHVKVGDRLVLGEDQLTIQLKGREIQCYYRWRKAIRLLC